MQLFPNDSETILFSLVVGLWVLSEIIGGAVIPWLRRSGGEVKKKDDGSVIIIRVLMYVSVMIAIFLAIRNVAMLPDWVFYPGIALVVIGVIVRQWAILVLGRFFTMAVGVQKNQKVVDNGPYRFIRHPSYLGLFFIIIGLGLALHSLVGILVLLVLNGLAFGYRIHVEEKALVSELGDDYVSYMERTKRLIPFIF